MNYTLWVGEVCFGPAEIATGASFDAGLPGDSRFAFTLSRCAGHSTQNQFVAASGRVRRTERTT